MKLQFKLNPALRRDLAPGDRRRWFFSSIALRIDVRAVSIWSFEIYWKRLLLGTSVLAVIGYLTLVTALFFWLDRHKENRVTWLDLATAPVRWDNLRKKRGETAIETAFSKFEERDFVEGFYNLRVGLSRAQDNVKARVMLARLYAGSDPAQALATLETGLKHAANDPALLRALFSYYAQLQAQGRALEQTEKLLDPNRVPPITGEAREFLTVVRAGLVLERDPAETERLLSSLPELQNNADTLRAYRFRLDALVKLGRGLEALALPRPAAAKDSDDASELRAEAEIAIAREDATALDSALRRYKATGPDQPQNYIYAFQAWHRMKRLTLRDSVEQEYYRVFGANDAAMQLLAASAVNMGLSDVVHRAMQVAQRNRLSTFAFRVHLTELALRRGEFDQAFRLLRDWERSVETLKPMQRSYPDLVSRLVRACVTGGEQQQAGLVSQLGTMRGRSGPSLYVFTAETLERAGHLETARDVLQLGLRFYPYTDNLVELNQRVTGRLAELAAAAEKAKPVVAAVELPNTAALALQQLDELIADQSFLAARELLRAIRTGKPAWIQLADQDLALREAEVALLTQDPLAARAVVRSHLDRFRSEEDALKLVRLGESLLKRERVSEARIIHDEVEALRGAAPAVASALRWMNLGDDLAGSLASQAAGLAAIDRELAQNRPAEALRVLDYVRQKAPTWLAQARNELLAREVRIRLLLDQRPLAVAALRELVLRAGVSRATAFKLVRDYLADREEERALLLAREIVKLLPGDAAAKKLLSEAEAPRPTD